MTPDTKAQGEEGGVGGYTEESAVTRTKDPRLSTTTNSSFVTTSHQSHSSDPSPSPSREEERDHRTKDNSTSSEPSSPVQPQQQQQRVDDDSNNNPGPPTATALNRTPLFPFRSAATPGEGDADSLPFHSADESDGSSSCSSLSIPNARSCQQKEEEAVLISHENQRDDSSSSGILVENDNDANDETSSNNDNENEDGTVVVEDEDDDDEDGDALSLVSPASDDDDPLQPPPQPRNRQQQGRPRRRSILTLLCIPCMFLFSLFILLLVIIFMGLPFCLFLICLLSAYYCCTSDPLPLSVLLRALLDTDADWNGAGLAAHAPGRRFTCKQDIQDELDQGEGTLRLCLGTVTFDHENISNTTMIGESLQTVGRTYPGRVHWKYEEEHCYLVFSQPFRDAERSEIMDELREFQQQQPQQQSKLLATTTSTSEFGLVQRISEEDASDDIETGKQSATQSSPNKAAPEDMVDIDLDGSAAAVGDDSAHNDHGDDETSVRERGTVCDICLAPFEGGDVVAWSSNPRCDHAYHSTCIVDWLLRQPTCPSCRQEYLPVSPPSPEEDDHHDPDEEDDDDDDDENEEGGSSILQLSSNASAEELEAAARSLSSETTTSSGDGGDHRHPARDLSFVELLTPLPPAATDDNHMLEEDEDVLDIAPTDEP